MHPPLRNEYSVWRTLFVDRFRRRRVVEDLGEPERADDVDPRTRDALTGLLDRTAFHDHLQARLTGLQQNAGAGIAVMLIDLDGFKAVNLIDGHRVGDAVLTEVARRLSGAVRADDTVARIGGDEFAVLCDVAGDAAAATLIAQRVLQSLTQPYAAVAARRSPTASIGVRLICDGHDQPHDIVREADAALYRAKREGKSCFRIFVPRGPESSTDDAIDLRERLDAGALVVHYQPVLDATSGEIVSVEALARLRGRDGSTLPPSQFIADAERSGMIDEIGSLVLRQACRDLAAIRREYPTLRVSVNVSPRQLADDTITATVATALREAALPAEALTLEITESTALSTVPRADVVVKALAGIGVQIALDDFGTGHSSLEMLRTIPAHELKIDRGFVSGVTRVGVEHDVVAIIIDLGHRRGLRVVAEGVETIEQADALGRLGCRYLQGFLYSRPVPLEELIGVLAHDPRSGPAAASASSPALGSGDDLRP